MRLEALTLRRPRRGLAVSPARSSCVSIMPSPTIGSRATSSTASSTGARSGTSASRANTSRCRRPGRACGCISPPSWRPMPGSRIRWTIAPSTTKAATPTSTSPCRSPSSSAPTGRDCTAPDRRRRSYRAPAGASATAISFPLARDFLRRIGRRIGRSDQFSQECAALRLFARMNVGELPFHHNSDCGRTP